MDKGVVLNLSKRARAKFVTNIVARPLARLNSPLQKAYKLSTTCAGELTEVPGKLTSLYCGCRWCIVCSRIRTAKLWNGYMPAIEAMAEKWFLTLSRPNVVGAALEDEIRYYLREASLIQRHLREKRKLEYSSLRKIECTYNEVVKTYHPHFHFIFDSWEAANSFLNEWLTRNPTAKLDKGNQLKKADDKSVQELFKYFTKVVSKTKSKAANGTESADYRIHLEALDRMFVAMRRVRTFQPCGVVKAVSEEIEPEQALESGRFEVNHWKWKDFDWMNVDTAAALTGYVPAPGILDIEKHLVYPAGVAVAPAADLTPYYVDRATGEVLGNEHAHQCRNSMQYAKIYPLKAPLGAARGFVCNPHPVAAIDALPKLGRRAARGAQPVCCVPGRVPLGEVIPRMNLARFQKPSRLISVDWESQRQQIDVSAPAPAPVAAKGPEMAPPLPLFAQPVAASGGAGSGGRVAAQPGAAARAARPGGALSSKKLSPVRKTTALASTGRTAQEPVTALIPESSLFTSEKHFSNMKTA